MFRRMWPFYGRTDKRGTPCQAKIPSKIFQEMSNYIKEIEKDSYFIINRWFTLLGIEIHIDSV